MLECFMMIEEYLSEFEYNIPDYSAESLVGELLEVLHNVDHLPGGVRILNEAVVSLYK